FFFFFFFFFFQAEDGIRDGHVTGVQTCALPISFILGCVPLWTATGAGSVARQIMGTAVIGGMLAASMIGIFFVPAIFYMVEKWSGAGKEHASGPLPAAPTPAEAD